MSKKGELTKKEKKEFKQLYLSDKKWNASKLRKKYKLRTKTIFDFAKECTNEYVRSLKNHNRKLEKQQVIEMIIEYKKGGITQKEVAEKNGISGGNFCNILARRNWKHLFQGEKKEYNEEFLRVIDK